MELAPNKKRSSLRRDHWQWLKVRQMPTGELQANGEIGARVVLSLRARSPWQQYFSVKPVSLPILSRWHSWNPWNSVRKDCSEFLNREVLALAGATITSHYELPLNPTFRRFLNRGNNIFDRWNRGSARCGIVNRSTWSPTLFHPPKPNALTKNIAWPIAGLVVLLVERVDQESFHSPPLKLVEVVVVQYCRPANRCPSA